MTTIGTKKIYIVAGEQSGDLHGSKLMREIKKQNSDVKFKFFGGDLMIKEGGESRKHIRDLAFMGLWEVLKNINTVKENMSLCKEDLRKWQPDAVILIDYPGFNMRIAKYAHEIGLKVYYYVSPQVWVWKKNRIPKIKKYVDKMFVILPFELDFYKQHNYDVFYFGNPTHEMTVEELNKDFDEDNFRKENKLSNKKIIALLPGSRAQEVAKILPIMVNVAKKFEDFEFVIAGLNSLAKENYTNFLKNSNIKIVFDKTFDLLKIAYSAVVTSGTATLETALFNVPQVVCYKTSKFSYSVGKRIVKIDFFSLVNILSKKEVVKELLQNNLENDIIIELKKITTEGKHRQKMISEYKELKNILGPTDCSSQIAKEILKF